MTIFAILGVIFFTLAAIKADEKWNRVNWLAAGILMWFLLTAYPIIRRLF